MFTNNFRKGKQRIVKLLLSRNDAFHVCHTKEVSCRHEEMQSHISLVQVNAHYLE